MSGSRTYLVTGCASGIGLALADALIARGERVIATDIAFERLSAHASTARWPQERVLVHRLDVADVQAWELVTVAGREAFGPIDVLINVAGFLRPAWLHAVRSEDFDLHFDVNVKGLVFGMRAVAGEMMARRHGQIINVASMASLAPIPGLGLYSASKYAARAITLVAAQELAEYGIRVTVVCPDAVHTPMLDLQKDYDEAELTFSAEHIMTPNEVVDVILRRALPYAPLEIYLPLHRGLLARIADLMPGTASMIRPWLARRGRKKQARLRSVARH